MDSFILFRHQTTDIRHQSLSGDKLMGTPFHLICLGQKIKQKNANVLTMSYVYCLIPIPYSSHTSPGTGLVPTISGRYFLLPHSHEILLATIPF